jgi:hypothetical protein
MSEETWSADELAQQILAITQFVSGLSVDEKAKIDALKL